MTAANHPMMELTAYLIGRPSHRPNDLLRILVVLSLIEEAEVDRSKLTSNETETRYKT